MKRKRMLWLFAAIFAVLLMVFAAIFTAKLMIVHYNHFWKYSADYKNFADDFNLVKNYVTAEFPDESDKWLSVSNRGSEGITLFDPELESYLVLPDDVAASLASIRSGAFPDKDSNFDTIRINEGRISFCISSGEYALVYSPDKKPMWVNSSSEDTKVKVKAIQDGWYHVTKNK